jgi:cholesterol transport system auxiliary component
MMKNDFLRMYIGAGIIFIVLVLFTGCFQRTKTPYVVEYFTFDYSSPVVPGLTSIDGLIRIERFSVAHSFNSTAMVFKPQAYRIDSYSHSRWRVNPGDMTGDFLIRDLRKAALFKEVFSYHSDERVRFTLEGAIEEFFESDEGPASNAILIVNVTLLDMNEKEITRRLRFQKTYRYSKALNEKSPEGFAKGMSANMALFSDQLIKDLNSALK